MAKRTTLPAGMRPATLPDAEAAVYCGVSENKFRKMRDEGLLPKARKAKGRNLNIISELDAALTALPTADDAGPGEG